MARSTTALLLACSAFGFAASADTLLVEQEFRLDVSDPNGRNLFIQAWIDLENVTGAESERVLTRLVTLREEFNGIGQNFYFVAQPDPPTFDLQGSIFGRFQNGVFTNQLGTTNPFGGNGFASLARNTPEGPITAVAIIGAPVTVYGTILFNNQYILVSTVTSIIPAPCPADLTGPALDGVPDGTVDAADLTFYLDAYIAQFSTAGGGGPNGFNADLTGPALEGNPDTTVDASDLTFYLDAYIANFGNCP